MPSLPLSPPPNPRWPRLQIAPAVNTAAWSLGRVAAAICLLSVVPFDDPQLAAGQRFTFIVAVGAACLPIADRATARRVGPAIIVVIAFFVVFGDDVVGDTARQLEAATGRLLLVTTALLTLVVIWLGEALWDKEAEHPRSRVSSLAVGGLLILGLAVGALGAQGDLKVPILGRPDWHAVAALVVVAGLPLLALTPWPRALSTLDKALGARAGEIRDSRLRSLGVRDFGVCPRSEAALPMIVGSYAGLLASSFLTSPDVYSYGAALGALAGGALWLGLYLLGRRKRSGWSWRRRSCVPALLVCSLILVPVALVAGINDGTPVLGALLAGVFAVPGLVARTAFPLK